MKEKGSRLSSGELMKTLRVPALLLLLSLCVMAQQQDVRTAPKSDERLKADVLLIVAHPDDETGVIAYLAQLMDQGKRVAVVYLTHGEAGHNNMGRERAAALGEAREMELRRALTSVGVQNVWFLGGRDTPSQDVLQSLGNWHHGQALEDVVRMIRITRPYVILTWLPAIFMGENHGDHQAAGVVATEAFDLAGDPSAFPAQIAQPRHVNETLLEGLQPWQPQKIYYFSDARDDKQFKDKGPSYAVTAISPKRNQPYWRIAMDAFRFHRTQYNSYIEKLDKMSDDELAKLAAADQDGWASPLQFIFGKSLVSSSATGDVLEGINLGPIAYVRPPAPPPVEPTGLTFTIGGPWNFYENFRRAHALEQLPVAEIPEIAIGAGTTLQVPLIIRNDTNQAADVSFSTTLPAGWAQKDISPKSSLSAGEVAPIQIELTTPAKKSDQIAELAFQATATRGPAGVVKMRVRVGSGGLPQ
jgi:LmbE family N-acetylglucosaminyl deacetylase